MSSSWADVVKRTRSFKYRPLSSSAIRLLRILRYDQQSRSIICVLDHYDVHDCPSYTALSYTWGTHDHTWEIIVDGRSIRVRSNLYKFLRQAELSSDLNDRLFWIDQISINQEDVEERNQQVERMGSIFQQAAHTVIWLGEATEVSNSAMQLIRFVVEEQASTREQRVGMPGSKGILVSSDNLVITKEEADAVQHLLERPYWSRLWIVQEIVLAANIDIWCGSESIPWSSISSFLTWEPCVKQENHRQYVFNEVLSSSTKTILGCRQYQHGAPHFSLPAAINCYAGNCCTDPRDKIYGLLGIIHSSHELIVDYNKSLVEVFVDTLNWYLGMTRKHGWLVIRAQLPEMLGLGRKMGLLSCSIQEQRIFDWIKQDLDRKILIQDMIRLINEPPGKD